MFRSTCSLAVLIGLLVAPAPPTARAGTARALRDSGFVLADSVEAQIAQVSDLAVAGDGSIYLTDPGFPAVLHFDPSGQLRRVIGRRGQGPGEFERPQFEGMVHDSLWVYDAGQGRIAVVPPSGQGGLLIPVRMFAAPVPGGTLPRTMGIPMALVPGGELVVWENVSRDPRQPQDPDWAYVLRATRRLEVVDTLASYSALNGGLVFRYPDGETHLPQPFTDASRFQVSSDGRLQVLVERPAARGPGEQQFRVTAWQDGREQIYRRQLTYQPAPLSPATVDSAAVEMAKPVDPHFPTPITADSVRRRIFRPKYYPPVEVAVVARDGTVWLKTRFADARDGANWMQLSPRGLPMTYLQLPGNFRMLEADGRLLYGYLDRPGDLPEVVRYRVERS